MLNNVVQRSLCLMKNNLLPRPLGRGLKSQIYIGLWSKIIIEDVANTNLNFVN